jgi:transcriptional regulator with XRE-family HTH domain
MKTQTQSDVDFNSVIGLKIKARRRELKLSQTDLGNSLGVSFQQIQKYEKGLNGCSAKRIEELSKALHVSILYFFNSQNNEVNNDQSESR